MSSTEIVLYGFAILMHKGHIPRRKLSPEATGQVIVYTLCMFTNALWQKNQTYGFNQDYGMAIVIVNVSILNLNGKR